MAEDIASYSTFVNGFIPWQSLGRSRSCEGFGGGGYDSPNITLIMTHHDVFIQKLAAPNRRRMIDAWPNYRGSFLSHSTGQPRQQDHRVPLWVS
jgi:hypothetical protein